MTPLVALADRPSHKCLFPETVYNMMKLFCRTSPKLAYIMLQAALFLSHHSGYLSVVGVILVDIVSIINIVNIVGIISIVDIASIVGVVGVVGAVGVVGFVGVVGVV